MDVPRVTLNNGVEIPQLGFGLYKVSPADTPAAIDNALHAGYRHFDTAAMYGNEAAVGAALAEATGYADRGDVFVTTKIWNTDHGYDEALAAFDVSMGRLGLDVLDLLLIHWPVPGQDRYVETYRALEALAGQGRVRAIGVSNFQLPHLERLLAETDIVPAINQIELHPMLPQSELRAFHAEHGIVTEAWSPLARGGSLLAEPVLTAIAGRLGRTPAQIVLRWQVQLGNVVIPKSITPARIAENIDVFDFSLTDEDFAAIATLDRNRRVGSSPDEPRR